MTGWVGIMAFAVVTFATGAALGWLFYAGLYGTVRELTRTRRPAMFPGASLLWRMAMLLAGLWLVMRAGMAWLGSGAHERWLMLVPAMLGLLTVRSILLRRYGRPGGGTPTRRHPWGWTRRSGRSKCNGDR